MTEITTMNNRSDNLVITHNDLNKISFPDLTRKELDFLYGMIMTLYNKGSETVRVSFDELLSLVEMTFLDRTEADLGKWIDNFSSKVAQSVCPMHMIDLERGERFAKVPFFDSVIYSLEESYIEFSINKKFEYIVNENRSQYMVFSFGKFKSFKRKYDKRLYTLLSQWKKFGKLTVNLEEFKRLMDTPDTYKPTKIKQFIVDPSVLALSETFPDLKQKVEKTKGRVTGYTFTWDGEYFSRRQIEEVNEKVQRRVNAAMKRTEKKSIKTMVNDELSQRKEPINTITQEEVDSILSLYFNKDEESFG